MARKRMFDNEVINQDSFFDLPKEAIALYFLLGMNADDEGFVAPKRILRLYGISEDNLKVLVAKSYVIKFETGVIVITDWKRNNYLDKNKVVETIYQKEKKLIDYNEQTQKYQWLNQSLTEVKPELNESLRSIEENSIEENSIEENSIDNKSSIVVAEGEITDKEIEPDINNKKKIPYDEIVKLYHQICLSLPKVIKLTESRKKTIKARYEEYDRDIGVFRKVFQYAEDNDFYKGNNNNNWKADFDWLISPNKMIKILEKANNVEMKEEKTEEKANERKWQ